jgi:hypothetical protein
MSRRVIHVRFWGGLFIQRGAGSLPAQGTSGRRWRRAEGRGLYLRERGRRRMGVGGA